MDSNGNGQIVFPLGTTLIKSFGYADAKGKLKIIETRLLLRRQGGWVALPYVWRKDGKDADLKLGGMRVPVSFKKPGGAAQSISYSVPNKNQCKQCHSTNDAITPIGTLWQNMIFASEADKQAILNRMMQKQEPPASARRAYPISDARWDDPKAALEERASAYLRVNCGHCHKPSGSASNSGLFFDDHIGGPVAMGIGKRPVAAGRGAGDFDFVIEPGHPERSILIHRMKSVDPGIAMPELGRATVHDEGVTLLEDWIRGMKP